jgi:hypothetical protein
MTSKEQRVQVMKEAWAIYHFLHTQYAPWQFERGIHDGSMRRCLTTAWEKSKKQRAEEAMLAALTPDQRDQLDRLLQAREDCIYLPLQMSMKRETSKIDEQIKSLVGFYYRK